MPNMIDACCCLSCHQFFADADDADTWMMDMLRLVSSEDVGHDEASVQSLVKKHRVSVKFLIERYSIFKWLC